MQVSVFRVEQPSGYGPYSPEYEEALYAMFEDHSLSAKNIGPAHDPQLDGIQPGEHCGFATLDALDEWFDGYHESLQALGFVIAKYLVPLPLVRYGKQQVVFHRGDLWPAETMLLT